MYIGRQMALLISKLLTGSYPRGVLSANLPQHIFKTNLDFFSGHARASTDWEEIGEDTGGRLLLPTREQYNKLLLCQDPQKIKRVAEQFKGKIMSISQSKSLSHLDESAVEPWRIR